MPAKRVEIPTHSEGRGHISWLEEGEIMPFEPKRVFYIYGVPVGVNRGGHAHREDHQFLVAVHGKALATYFSATKYGSTWGSIWLNEQRTGIYVPPLTWLVLQQMTPTTIVLALSSGKYREEDYIRDPEEYTKITGEVLPAGFVAMSR